MIQKRLVILGGSTPFCAALINELRNEPPMDLMLFGRNRSNLRLIADYSHALLSPAGWHVRTARRLEDALAGADIVVHQIRYGGLEEREKGEYFCSRFGLTADETLGPAALRTALQAIPGLRRTRDALARFCPAAWLLNLTNPLSVVTAVLAVEPATTVGLCELPEQTAQEAARIFGLRLQDIEWEYSGLNHRGFIHRFRQGGRDLLGELPEVLCDRRIGGITGEQIAELNAIPEKYYRLLLGYLPDSQGRAHFLRSLKETLIAELRCCSNLPPPSLEKRDLSWYRAAVVPMIRALSASRPRSLVVNLFTNGLVEEVKATVSNKGVLLIPASAPRGRVRELLLEFRRHEHAFLQAMLKPSLKTIEEALTTDPTVPRTRRKEVSMALWQDVKRTTRERGRL
jgi:6-phospho-beta-glucosidase